ncbi:MAG: aminotransferase class V-fold PLP-dependent enzyme, partial [Planctomycetota bacterium]
NACLGTEPGDVIGSTVEHPATRSASKRWAKVAGHRYLPVPHDNETGTVRAEHYAEVVTPETRVATILHTSPVTGMGMDVPAIVGAIRAVAPSCLVIVDGIQHAAHGDISIDSYGVDGYAISPYKMFSRHGFGVAWISDRLTAVPHDALEDGPEDNWELGTRDAGCYAAFTAVPHYLDWLGSKVSDVSGRRARIEAAAAWIHEHETSLTDVMLHGTGNLQGLADLPGLTIVGGVDNPCREGLVTFAVDGRSSPDVVTELRHHGIRTHTRKADHYSGSVLKPLGLEDAVRVSLCHYNTKAEVAQFLAAMAGILAD